jgi:hypothetical protein
LRAIFTPQRNILGQDKKGVVSSVMQITAAIALAFVFVWMTYSTLTNK